MNDDLVKRLREYAIHMDAWGKEANHDADIVDEAADRIAKLEAALREIEAHPEPYLYADEMAIIAYNALNAE